MENGKIYKCFIASPSDVKAERDACDEIVSSINRTIASQLNMQLRVVRWETDAHPAIGADGQEVINEQLHPEDADFFIGIFWSRFGTPTPRANSGSEEEFERAYTQWQKTKSNKILFFFKTEKLPVDVDTKQLDKVQAFRDKISACGCFYKQFGDLEQFKRDLQEALTAELMQFVKNASEKSEHDHAELMHNTVQKRLDLELKESLSLYSGQNVIWIDRKICNSKDVVNRLADSYEKAKDVSSLLDETDSCVIKAPPQYGLTGMAHFLRAEAWKRGKAWLYIDAEKIKLRKLEDIIQAEQEMFNGAKIDCVLLDSWRPDMQGAQKIFERILSLLPDARYIVLEPSLDRLQALQAEPIRVKKNFRFLRLLPLAKCDVRKAVSSCAQKYSLDEDTMVNRIVMNLDTLNIHRTPLNCWMLLKVAEGNADIGAVNRTEMLERVLFVLFNLFEAPTYTTKPDVKICERLLGPFCGQLVREQRIDFSEAEFRKSISQYIEKGVFDIDVSVLWDILTQNKIIINVSGPQYRFGSSFWLYFFAAKYMMVDADFREFVFKERQYVQYPEIVEFYTGSDRDRADILELLDKDLLQAKEEVEAKIGLPKDFNPLNSLQWKKKESPEEDARQMNAIVNKAVERSKIPSELKDQYSDMYYDFSKPYDQTIHNFVKNASFYLLIQQVRAASRALRNSDFVDVKLRLRVLQHIISCWAEINRVLFFMARSLARTGMAFFEGFGFVLDEEYQKELPDFRNRVAQILQECPMNTLHLVKDDLSSQRQAPLLYKWDEEGANAITRHLYMMYLIYERPRGWEVKVRSYLRTVKFDSYYLHDILLTLQSQQECGYPLFEDESRLTYLIRDCAAIHFQCNRGSLTFEKKKENEDSGNSVSTAEV